MTESTGEGVDQGEASKIARRASLENDIITLRAALTANRASSTAVGLLMARLRLTRDEAFGLLVTQSQQTDTRVGALALELVLAADAEAASRRRD